MTALPHINPNNVFSAGFSSLCPRLKRAAGRYSSLDPVAHQFSFHAQQQVCRQALAKLFRVSGHPKSLLSVLTQWVKIYLQARPENWKSQPAGAGTT